jgi:pimeloyl-ACP methyl ester carboxylesterase
MRILLRLIAGLAAVLALALLGIVAWAWAPDRPVAELTARWAPPPSQFVRIDGFEAHVRDEGRRDDPQPLVLLHGTSASLHTWDGWVRSLEGSHRVIRVDMPGFGLTGPAPDGDYTIDAYVRFVEALLDHYGLERCVLVGNSFGGRVAWEAALADPVRVRALVLVDSAGYAIESQSVPIAFRLARVPGLNRLLSSVTPRMLVEASVTNVYGDPAKVTPELVDRYYELTLREGNRGALVQRFVQAPAGPDQQRIHEIAVPTLIIWGGRDRLIPPEYGLRFEQDIAGSLRVEFPALGHVPHEEDPAATVAVVRDFLATLPTPDG